MRHKIRTFATVFEQGCRVYYKRDSSNIWKGPGIVCGLDGKTIFIRHGSYIVRVSSNRIIKAGTEFQPTDSDNSNIVENNENNANNHHVNSESDDEKNTQNHETRGYHKRYRRHRKKARQLSDPDGYRQGIGNVVDFYCSILEKKFSGPNHKENHDKDTKG